MLDEVLLLTLSACWMSAITPKDSVTAAAMSACVLAVPAAQISKYKVKVPKRKVGHRDDCAMQKQVQIDVCQGHVSSCQSPAEPENILSNM
jgi:hypothetical protein